MLFIIKFIVLSCVGLCFEIAAIAAVKAQKVDLEKIYNESKNWATNKLTQDNKALKEVSGDSRCYGGLALPKPCSKKNTKTEKVIEKTKNSMNEIPLNDGKKILVFVSLSMPKQSLRLLMQQALKYNATLVMRGLKGDSFKQTAAFIREFSIVEGSGFEINPKLFETYAIKQVPTFVLVKEDQEIARLKGNVSLAFASSKLNEA